MSDRSTNQSASRATQGSTIDKLLREAARGNGRIIFPGHAASIADVQSRSDEYAAHLRATGVRPGDRIVLWMPPSPDLVAAVFASSQVGGVAVPLSDRYKSREVAHVLRTATPSAVLTVEHDTNVARDAILRNALAHIAQDGNGEPPRVITDNDVSPASRQLRDPVAGVAAKDDVNLAMLMFTSGTAAEPKACMLTHSALLHQADALARERYLLTSDSVVWSPLPLFHIAGLVSMLATLTAGATFVHAGHFQTATSLPLLESQAVTHALAAFETIWMQLLDDAAAQSTDLSSIRVGLSANGEQQLRALSSRLPGVAFVANYGLTEACGHVAMARADEPADVRILGGGVPLPGTEVRIVDPDAGTVVMAGQRGEIQFRGAAQFVGYYGDPAGTKAATTSDGWFRSGDLGRMDDTGRLYFTGRLKDMLKVGGENVAAAEVEAFLCTHPAVSIAAVVPAADDVYGEVPAAFVQLAPGAQLTEEDVIDYCLDAIATFKVPRYVRFVSQWPMSGTKIRKADLSDKLRDELDAAGITAAPRLRTHGKQHS